MVRAGVVSGFPGIGKSWLFENSNGLILADSDSSNFSWADGAKKVRHFDWPSNYIKHIGVTREFVHLVFVSSHPEVRDALLAARIPFTLVYPGPEMKDEYIARYVARGNAPDFVRLLKANYESWIKGLQAQRGCRHIALRPGEYLSDVIGYIL